MAAGEKSNRRIARIGIIDKTTVKDEYFAVHFKDIIDFRTMDYYKRRYDKKL